MAAMYFIGTGSLMALVSVAFMFVWIRRRPGGNPEMLRISGAAQKNTNAYLRRRYKGAGIFFAAVFIIPLVMTFCGFLSFFTPFAFLTDSFFSGLSGFIGIRTATMVNCRTAQGASRNLNKGLRVAFSTGSVMGFTMAGLGLLDLAAWYFILNIAFGALPDSQRIAQITANMLTFGMGASSMALFARAGGGIFTRAADMGADLVGKMEAGIPEDGLRNPAVIADDVSDNVGDVVGMGADLYESHVDSTVSTIALVVAAGYGGKGMAVPTMLAALGVLASILETFLIKTEKDAPRRNLLKALRTGTYINAALVVVTAYAAIRILPPDHMGIYVAILSGLVVGVLIEAATEYYTSDTYNPARKLAASSWTGRVTIIISGLSLSILPTAAPVVIVGVSALISYHCPGGSADFNAGLYGMGVSAADVLSTLDIALAADAYGLVADSAGGTTEMAHTSEEMHQRIDALDSLGNTTAVTDGGFAIGSAVFTALALIASYTGKVKQIDPSLSIDLSITNPMVLIGLFIGDMLSFLFAALTMETVGEATRSTVVEVRRQLRETKGLMEGKAEPDYGACMDVCTIPAQRLVVAPATAAVTISVAVGLLLGPEGVSGLLTDNTVTGFVLAVMVANIGGAWDNARKYIESRRLGGKDNEERKAAAIGDTVGDPFKDVSGLPINILIKLAGMISIVFAGLIVTVHLP